jgi:hypothetical protein
LIHPNDYAAMEKLFRGQDIPDDLVDEYEIQRKMCDAYGHVGALGMNLVIPMMRRLGYGKIVQQTVENVDWRRHMGENVIASYGDQKVAGKLTGLGIHHLLGIELQGYGYVELPRYCVQLAPTRELQVTKDAWGHVKKGAAVTVKTDKGPKRGRFVESTPDGVRVKIGDEEAVYPPENVELFA